MVDPVQNLPGTITSANIPSRSDNGLANVSHSSVDNSSSPSGTSAPAPAVPASSEGGLQLSDAAKRGSKYGRCATASGHGSCPAN